jgi:hypothetical protein
VAKKTPWPPGAILMANQSESGTAKWWNTWRNVTWQNERGIIRAVFHEGVIMSRPQYRIYGKISIFAEEFAAHSLFNEI